jgi:hypothetical protein
MSDKSKKDPLAGTGSVFEQPKPFTQKAAEFVDALTGMQNPEEGNDAISQSWDPMDVIPVERAASMAKQAFTGIRGALQAMRTAPTVEAYNKAARELADLYAKQRGMSINHVPGNAKVDEKFASRIADAFERMPHNPDAPEVQRAYGALVQETEDQFKLLKESGLKVSKIKPGMENPYKTSKDLHEDIRKNNHMWYFPTESGFGSEAAKGKHPLLVATKETIDGEPILANDMFRIVHDYFGHVKEHTSFGPRGEEAAWRAHMQMFSPEAQKALTTETRGQNSWVNFGPKGAQNRANPGATTYAEQKAGLLPDWAMQTEPKPKRLVHYSRHDGDLAEIDPNYHGTGAAGRESKRGNIVPRSYYYEEGTEPEELVASGAKKIYTVEEPANIIDFNSPEAEKLLVEGAWNDASDLERRAKELGYAGFKNSHPSNPVPNAVALFDKQPVVSQEAAKKAAKAAAAAAAIGAGSQVYAPEEAQAVGFAEGGQVGMQDTAPQGLDDFLMTPIQPGVGEMPAGLEAFIAPELQQAKYGTPGQVGLTALEGAAQGLAGPLATAFETEVLGVDPEAMRGRAEANPGTAIASEVAGFVAPALLTAGASAAAKAGVTGAAKAVPMLANVAKYTQAGLIGSAAQSTERFVVNQIGKDAVRGAFEAALYQGGHELSRAFKEDPAQTAETAMVDIGLAGVMGGAFSAGLGLAMRKMGAQVPTAAPELPTFISEVDRPKLDAGDFVTSINHTPQLKEQERKSILEGLRELKPETPEIRAAAERLQAPVMEGMISNSRWVQKGEDMLINGAPTYSGLRRQAMYNEGWEKATHAVDEALGAESKISQAELGQMMRDSFVKRIEHEYAPIEALYAELKANNTIIPIADDAAQILKKELGGIAEARVSPSSPEGRAVRRALSDIQRVQTVDDLRALKSTFSVQAMARPEEKRLASIIQSKLEDLEELSIERAAKMVSKGASSADRATIAARMQEMIALKDQAKAAYKPFIQDIQELVGQLGKKAYGAKHAIQILKDELTAEQITSRLFTKKNSEFLEFFRKKFPEEMRWMQGYQKNALREAASKEGLSPKLVFNQVNKLEPEIQNALFSKAELQRLRDAETYVRSFPKNFNPSGTSGAIAFRDYFTPGARDAVGAAVGSAIGGPLGAVAGFVSGKAAANARDLAIEKFIQSVVMSPEAKGAVALAKATVAGEKLAKKAVKAVFQTGKDVMPAAVIPMGAHRERLSKLVGLYESQPEKVLELGANSPVPEYSEAFVATTTRAVQYLSSIKPDEAPKNPLDAKQPVSAYQKAEYNRALDIAQQPLAVLDYIKKATLTPQDVGTLKAIYPAVYKKLSQELISGVMEAHAKEEMIPYQTRMQLSLFLGQPLDSTMTPEGITSAQERAPGSQPESATMPASGAKHSMAGMGKLADSAQTHSQSREAARAGR